MSTIGYALYDGLGMTSWVGLCCFVIFNGHNSLTNHKLENTPASSRPAKSQKKTLTGLGKMQSPTYSSTSIHTPHTLRWLCIRCVHCCATPHITTYRQVNFQQSGLKYILDAFKKNTDSKGSPMGASLFSVSAICFVGLVAQTDGRNI